MTQQNALISGAGIAGPALAYWLVRGGWQVTVVERAPELRTGGQAVDLRGAGRTVMDRMGLLDRARELGLDQRGFAFVDGHGRVTARMPVDAFEGGGIVSEIEILRGDLGRVLYDASLQDTEYRFGDSITWLRQTEEGVEVGFERSAPRHFDVVVGADGLGSVVRRLAIGPDERCLRDLGLLGVGWTATLDLDLDQSLLMYNLPGGLVASARPGRLPGEVKASFGIRTRTGAPIPADADAARSLVASRFAGAGWEVPRLVESMWSAPDLYVYTTAQVRLDRWSQGRVVLLGDAGYCPTPLTGLGTSLALVGAYVLAGELRRAGGDHRIAFARYEERMRPYVAQAQELPPGGVDGFAPRTAAMIRMRALSMRWMTRWPVRSLMAGVFQKADAIELPNYAEQMKEQAA
jgi:2-polyprenyl-6-methoxyphenol hydroxylase-like FAD-dependent oxidoreductase